MTSSNNSEEKSSKTESSADQRIKDWLRSLKKSLSYNGEWEQEDDEISKLILESCLPVETTTPLSDGAHADWLSGAHGLIDACAATRPAETAAILAFQRIVSLSDSEMRDGDEARAIAQSELDRASAAATHPAAQVEGDRLPTSIAQFIMRAQHLLIEEQEKPNPDNALVGFLCDAVRLARETSEFATAPLHAKGKE